MKLRRVLAAAVATLLLSGAAHAAPKKSAPARGSSVDIIVTEVAGKNAYIKPGASAGVRRGSKITIGNREYVVSMATASSRSSRSLDLRTRRRTWPSSAATF